MKRANCSKIDQAGLLGCQCIVQQASLWLFNRFTMQLIQRQSFSHIMAQKIVKLFVLSILLTACKPSEQPLADTNPAPPVAANNADSSQPVATVNDTAEPEQALSLEELESKLGLKVMTEAWSGDLDGMMQRRVVRVLTVYGLGRYYIADAREQGFAVETMRAFEQSINLGKTPDEHVYVVFIPVNREQLLPGLLEGRGDIVVAGWTITPERQEKVDFSIPVSKPVQEILVTGPSAAELETVNDLSGKTVHVRESSSYYESLQALSERLVSAGLPPVDIQPISELLEDEDLLEMVAGGLLPWAVVDDYKAGVFEDVFPKAVIRRDLVLRDGGHIAYAFRKNSPQFAAALNAHVKNYRAGSLHGNILFNRYVRDYKWVENALDAESYGRFEQVAELFKKYGEQYGMDALLVAAQGYQESRLDQSVRSDAGAIGIMQLLPSTAADSKVGIPDISTEEPNIHAGVKYVQFLRSHYFSDPAIDQLNQTLLAMAAYNAGPNKISSLRKKAAAQGLDPNRWFGNVEVIAAKEIGRETVQYVANIYKYYVAYRLSAKQMTARKEERQREGLD